MAQLTYTVTVATGSLYLGGGSTGNVFYLNGVRDIDLTWVKGGTLRFDQSEATNDNHPLFFSTQNSSPQSNIYANGVTYYLDGTASQSDYFNTTNFNAATTRYVEVTPASETDFYYACYIHGIGMGGAIDVTQNTWGAASWNSGQWSDQTDIDLDVTGQQLQSSINSVTAFPAIGWGGDVWGSLVGGWGNLKDTAFPVSGTQLQSSIGEEGTEGEINTGWGRLEWGANGYGIAGTVEAQSFELQSTTPGVTVENEINVGWGRLEWGNGAWNVGYSVELGSLSLQSTIGEEQGFTNFTAEPAGFGLQSTIGDAHETTANGDVAVFTNLLQTSQGTAIGAQDLDFIISGIGMQSSIGAIEVGALTISSPDGIQLQTNVGEEDLAGGAIITLTGIQATSVTGDADGTSVADATGSQLQSSISSVTLTGNAGIDLTGIQLTGSLGSINITPWNEEDLGVNNTWTEVDLAA